MKLKLYFIGFLAIFLFCETAAFAAVPQIIMDPNERGLQSLVFKGNNINRNYIDHNQFLGDMHLSYTVKDKSYSINLSNIKPMALTNTSSKIEIFWQLPSDVRLYQTFSIKGEDVDWNITVFNRSQQTINITDMWVKVPIGSLDESIAARHNLCKHFSLNGNSSFLYWVPYDGQGNVLLMTMKEGTSMEYATNDGKYYLHSKTSVDRKHDTWRIPSSSKSVQPYQSYKAGFNFSLLNSYNDVQEKIFSKGGITVKVAPGMTVSPEMKVYCALKTKQSINKLNPEFSKQTHIIDKGKKNNEYIYEFQFSRLGENLITIDYGNNQTCYLDFFVTEPLETIIKKRASFLVNHQQHRDSTKWYNGLYSIWDMEKSELLSPDHLGDLRERFIVGGSDDPSNCKPLYLSEKNVIYPDKQEIASLEYYEKNFVWGKLQRTDKEYPYPYGIYGSDNWYENRSGKYGGYEDGGSGKGRMWRTFDYTTHFAIYYNLYRIAKDNPELVTYLDSKEYLERAYQTAMAFFKVPYNILMGKQWAFHGWCDWAYKQGNFHERYLLDIIKALKEEGRNLEADTLRNEWEKKVTYMIYEDPWPFGSEMYVDRTAYESSYYIGEYAKFNPIEPKEQFWYDKNKKKWYSYTSFDKTLIDSYLQNQLDANLAMRGIYEPGYSNLGTAWSGQIVNLDYMDQMGGVALLDYAFNFSKSPDKYINFGYNSLLSSWSLMNTGTKESNYGYWHKGIKNDGAVGWAYSPYQNSHTYMSYIKVGRGPWRYDGEIDHGLTGAIHGSGIYLLNDPDFGIISYGGNANIEKDGTITIIPYDGIRRQLRLLTPFHVSIALQEDGFRKGYPIKLKDEKKLLFDIENRLGRKHDVTIVFDGDISSYNFSVTSKGKEYKLYKVESNYQVKIPISDQYTEVIINNSTK
jgi:hypothetical protein